MRQPLQEHGAQGLFDVEIGQFESVSFNFSQLTGPPWVPHNSLIGYKLDFFCLSTLFHPPFFFFFQLRYPWCFFYFISLFLAEESCSFTPMFVSQL